MKACESIFRKKIPNGKIRRVGVESVSTERGFRAVAKSEDLEREQVMILND